MRCVDVVRGAMVSGLVGLMGCGSASVTGGGVSGGPTPQALKRVLFVGDSFTHGRYTPVRTYGGGGTAGATVGSASVVDENYGQTGARAESSTEPGPYGGVPGIFAQLAVEAGLNYDVHIEAISSTSLGKNYAAASSVIAQLQWSAVVLQELSTRPLTVALTGNSTSNPSDFCNSVKTIEGAVHGANSAAKVYLYETWARSDMAQTLAGSTTATGFDANYKTQMATLVNFYHNVYNSAALRDGSIAGVAPAGEAWARAYSEGVANQDPYVGTSSLPLLFYGINATNNPAITSADYAHPSVYGAYLSALVLFQQMTGTDVRTFGGSEKAAVALGISSAVAVQLQTVAWESVTNESATPINQTVDPCTLQG